MYTIFEAFIHTVPALINVGGLLVLFIFIFAVISLNFFSEVKQNYPMNVNFNFSNIFDSIIVLFVIHTGDTFFDLFKALKLKHDILNNCIEDPTYDDFVKNDH